MSAPRVPLAVQFLAWLLALLGVALFVLGLIGGVVVIAEWDNRYARAAMFIPPILILLGAGMVAVGKYIDRPFPDAASPTRRGFEVKAAPRDGSK
jgi:hypothetical protein